MPVMKFFEVVRLFVWGSLALHSSPYRPLLLAGLCVLAPCGTSAPYPLPAVDTDTSCVAFFARRFFPIRRDPAIGEAPAYFVTD